MKKPKACLGYGALFLMYLLLPGCLLGLAGVLDRSLAVPYAFGVVIGTSVMYWRAGYVHLWQDTPPMKLLRNALYLFVFLIFFASYILAPYLYQAHEKACAAYGCGVGHVYGGILSNLTGVTVRAVIMFWLIPIYGLWTKKYILHKKSQ